MKKIKSIILFIICAMMLSCGKTNNPEEYKEKVIEYLASSLHCTVEMFVRDCDLVIDSMSVINITVADSINIIEGIDTYIKKTEESVKILKQNENSFFFLTSDRKALKNGQQKLIDYNNLKAKLPEYQKEDKDKVIAKVFRAWVDFKLPLLGQISSTFYGLFKPDEVVFVKECTTPLIDYIENNKLYE